MRVIFLDIDGVLNNRYTKERTSHLAGIEMERLLYLKEIIDRTDAKIVLSSTWRLGMPKGRARINHMYRYLKRRFDEAKLDVYSTTPDIGLIKRGTEILAWIDEYEKGNEPLENFVVIDDEPFLDFENERLEGHVYKLPDLLRKDSGLKKEDIEPIIEILIGK